MTTTTPKRGSFASRTFAALRYPNYRLWFFGQLVSLFGTWMQTTAQGFLVFQLTQSPAYLGYVGFAAGMPAWVLTLYAGVIADRIPRRTLLLITQTAQMILAFALAALVFTGLVLPWHIVGLSLLLGIANAFEAPARLAFVRELVDNKDDLTNGIALNATMFNLATTTGPAVAGIAYTLVGPAWCFTLNGVSFLAVIGALLRMRIAPKPPVQSGASAWQELKVGIRYIVHEPAVRTLIALVGVTGCFGISFATLFPAWAVRILNGDAATTGLLQSARGLGAFIGALLIASLGRFHFKGRLLTGGTFAFPLLLIALTLTDWLPLTLIILVASGLAVIMIMNLANALVQTLVPDELRGRVMAVYSMIFFGMVPLGALWVGLIADYVGEPLAVLSGALVSLAAAVVIFIAVPRIRALA